MLLIFPLAAYGQATERLQPGKLYESGEKLFAPHFGFTGIVPSGWSGLLPRESEVFLLTSETTPAEIFVFAREHGNLNSMKKDWEKGFEMDVGLTLGAKAATIKENILSTEVVMAGSNTDKSKRGYAISRCGGHGPCVICLAITPVANYEATVKTAERFITSASFEAPSSASPYEDFDWKKFLSGKMVRTYAYQEKGSKETTINLCPDGSFYANVSKKGIMKNQNPQYYGKLEGIWTADGIGELGNLHFEFKKLSAMDIVLRIRDEKIYANDERYFVADANNKCK